MDIRDTNSSLEWLHKKTSIFLDERIEDTDHPIRGIYGIFIKNEDKENKNERYVYVGRSKSVYGRMFESNEGHVAMMREEKHFIPELSEANDDEDVKVFIKILKEVRLEFDNYYKDMQRLASAGIYYINKYQGINQCLNQVPEGTNTTEEDWESMKYRNYNQ